MPAELHSIHNEEAELTMQKYNLQLMFVIDELRGSVAAQTAQTKRTSGDEGKFYS